MTLILPVQLDAEEYDWIKFVHVDPLTEAANQPRVPAGSSKGGEFASKGGTSAPPRSGSQAAIAGYIKSGQAQFVAEGGTIRELSDSLPLAEEGALLRNVDELNTAFVRSNLSRLALVSNTKGYERGMEGMAYTKLAIMQHGTRRVALAPNGDVAGAIDFHVDGEGMAVHVSYLGSTGIMHGTGSVLMGSVVTYAASRGLPIVGFPSFNAERMWGSMGATTMDRVGTGGSSSGRGLPAAAVQSLAALL